MGKEKNGGSGPASNEDRVIEAMARMPDNIALMKMENENIVAMAKSVPRDHKSIIANIVDQLDAYPSFAAVAVYAKPVGKDPVSGQQKIARGLSIRAAEAIAEAYKYNRVQATVSPNPEDPDSVRVAALFVDYQNGRIWQDEGILSKWYKTRNGAMQKHADDRFFSVVVKAEVSRRIREVILRSVPPGLRQELLEMAQKRIAVLLTAEKVNDIIKSFKARNVTQEMLEKYVGRTIIAGWKEEDRLNLQGLFVAIEDGEISIEDAFAEEKAQPTGAGVAQVAGLMEQAKPPQPAQAGPQSAAPIIVQPQPSSPVKPPDKPALLDIDSESEEKDRENIKNQIHVTLRDGEIWKDGNIPPKIMQNLLLRAYGTENWTIVGALPLEQLKNGPKEGFRGFEQIKEDIKVLREQRAAKPANK